VGDSVATVNAPQTLAEPRTYLFAFSRDAASG